MDKTIAVVGLANGYDTARVLLVEEWGGYGWSTDSFTNGPFETAEEAGEALADELIGKARTHDVDLMIARCRLRDRRSA